MAQSLSQLYVHIIFHIKNNGVEIRETEDSELYRYVHVIVKETGSIPIIINGTGNHIHIFCSMSKNITLAKLVEDIKRNSSRWIKTKGEYYKDFAWQAGYAGYSVSQSQKETVKQYIEKQKEHHKKQSFKEEYIVFLQNYGIEYDERYLWP